MKSKKLFSQSAKRKVSPHPVQIAWGCEIHEIGLYLILWPSEWKITRSWSNRAQCVTCRALWQIIDFLLMYPVKQVVPSTPALVGFAVVVVVGNALQASRLCSPDTNWWLNGHVWARRWFGLASPPRRPQMTRWHSGRLIWRRQKGHAAPRATDVTSVARSVWGGADKMWVSPAWTHSSPELFQSPFTINTGRKAQCSLFFSLVFCLFFFSQINSQTQKILFSASSATMSLVC